MAVRYFIKYLDIVDVEHKLNIYDDNYVGEPIQVDGNVTLSYSDTDDALEAIRGQGLSVELLANKDLTFSNLWSEDEKTFKVEYLRDNVILFNGWLNPEGFFENYVDTNWVVSFDCVDGLGYLKDLSFVENSTGLPITGKKKYIEILALALVRTGLNLRINTDVQIRYNGLSEDSDIFDNVYANTERYIEDDGSTIMSCDDVIRDILEPFGAVLSSYNNEWYIYKPNQLYSNQIATFYKYSYEGIAYAPPVESYTKDLNFSNNLGSHWNNATLFHCGANQKISNKSSLGAYRINYKFGLVKSIFSNTTLYSDDGYTIDSFDIINTDRLDSLVPGGYGIVFNASSASPIEHLRSNPIAIPENYQTDIYIRFTAQSFLSELGYFSGFFRFVIADSVDFTTANKYYLKQNFTSWGSVNSIQNIAYVSGSGGEKILELKTPTKPEDISGDGYLFIQFLSFQFDPYLDPITIKVKLDEVRVSPSENTGDSANIKGEFHTFQRTDKPSAKIKETKIVATGDNVADFYEGTIYKTDSVTPTEVWNRKGFTESKPLLQIMGEETLRLNQSSMRVFSGDVFGFFSYLSVMFIDGVDGVFMPISYIYETKNNVINVSLKQIYNEELSDISYLLTKDYGNTVEPTIK